MYVDKSIANDVRTMHRIVVIFLYNMGWKASVASYLVAYLEEYFILGLVASSSNSKWLWLDLFGSICDWKKIQQNNEPNIRHIYLEEQGQKRH